MTTSPENDLQAPATRWLDSGPDYCPPWCEKAPGGTGMAHDGDRQHFRCVGEGRAADGERYWLQLTQDATPDGLDVVGEPVLSLALLLGSDRGTLPLSTGAARVLAAQYLAGCDLVDLTPAQWRRQDW